MEARVVTRHTVALFILVLSICIIYSATTSYPWHFDDTPNILINEKIHLKDLSLRSMIQAVHGSPLSNTIARPVSFNSLAINWYIGQRDTFGYHLFNIFIHILNALLLYKTTVLLFTTPRLAERYTLKNVHHIALLSALFWAIHPIQIQAVTYIVQRMASLATFFYMAALYWYFKSRLTPDKFKKYLFTTLTVISFCLALGSKENTAFFPFVLLIVEYIFFPKKSTSGKNYSKLFLIILCCLILTASFYFLYNSGIFHTFFNHNSIRPFSTYERVLTQPRVILFYLGLLSYPLPIRFSITHDFALSTSFFSPITTTPSFIIIFSIFLFAILKHKKYPFFSFSILFFLINHIIESSFLQLEMIFEHRNYLPSLFIFLPISLLLVKGLELYRFKNKIVYSSIILFITGLVFLLGWGTYLRNNIWSSHETLWADAQKKAPNSARPLTYLGQIYGWEKEKNETNFLKAISYYNQAISKYGPSKPFANHVYANLAGLYFNHHSYHDAAKYYHITLKNDPKLHQFRYGYAQVLILLNRFPDALKELNYLLANANEINQLNRAYELRGLLMLWAKRPDQALKDYTMAMRISTQKEQYFYDIGVTFSLMGNYQKGKWFIEKAIQAYPNSIPMRLSLIETALKANKLTLAQQLADKFCLQFKYINIKKSFLDTGAERYRDVPIDRELIKPYIAEALNKLNVEFSSL